MSYSLEDDPIEYQCPLQYEWYPHLFDIILQNADFEALSVLAQTCRKLREKVYNNYLPLRHAIADKDLKDLMGVADRGWAVEIPGSVTRRHLSAIQVLDLIGWNFKKSRTEYDLSPPQLSLAPNLRIVRDLCNVAGEVYIIPRCKIFVSAFRAPYSCDDFEHAGRPFELDEGTEYVVSLLYRKEEERPDDQPHYWTLDYGTWDMFQPKAGQEITFLFLEALDVEVFDRAEQKDDNISAIDHVTREITRWVTSANCRPRLDYCGFFFDYLLEWAATDRRFWDHTAGNLGDGVIIGRLMKTLNFMTLDEYKAKVGDDFDVIAAQTVPIYPTNIRPPPLAQRRA